MRNYVPCLFCCCVFFLGGIVQSANSCPVGWYGNTCDQECSPNCLPYSSSSRFVRCERDSGYCTDGCQGGRYGNTCEKECSTNCAPYSSSRGIRCSRDFGYCLDGCQSGWEGADCSLKTCSANCARNRNYDVCDRYNGMCIYGCQSGWEGADCSLKTCSANCARNTNYDVCDRNGTCIYGCKVGFHGDSCEQTCSSNCLPYTFTSSGRRCHRDSGYCIDGCVVGYYGDTCSNTCPATCRDGCGRNDGYCTRCVIGFYNTQCSSKCPAFCIGGCAKSNGHCIECPRNRYGSTCDSVCSVNCAASPTDNRTCDVNSGSCPYGCVTGWYGTSCTLQCNELCIGGCDRRNGYCTSCVVGYYGDTCSNTCPATCRDGCGRNDGYCTRCQVGLYGNSCEQACSSNCLPYPSTSSGRRCHNYSGYCIDGCIDGWYGDSCNMTCRGSCFGGCNRTTGKCTSCKGNFTIPECTECTPSFYGMNCTEVCGRCINDETCSPVNGLCANGCMEGFSGNNCKMPIASVTQSATAGIVGGVIAGLAVIIAVLIIVIMYGRRRRQMKNESTEEKSGNGEPFYNNILTQEMHPGSDTTPLHVYGNITSSSSHGLQPRKMPRKNISVTNDTHSPSDDKCNAGVDIHKYENVGAVASSGQNLVLKQSHDARVSLSGAKDIKTDAEDDVFEEGYDDIYNSEDIYSAYKPDKPSPQLDALQRSLLASLASGELSTQFELLPKGMISSHKEGVKPANIKKNRFKALCAYDHSRVILHRPAGDPDTDYINANYIKGYKKDKAYIAAQGPRSSTVNDMWWTIWQEGITQIVMLTNLTEDGKNKCDEYWPKAGTTCTYGHVEITNVDEEQRADFIKRSFSIKEKGTTAKRQLEQYHYVAWPDHGVPPATSLVNFWRYIKARADPKAPPFVHCSAGVGRTGTYIALDIAMDIAVDKGDVDVHNIVNNLRKDRCIMVQAEAQYKFLHEVILEAYTSHKTRLTFKRFHELFPEEINIHKNNKIIDNEYKMLQQMGEFHPKAIHDVSSSKANINKNRNVNALPDDNHVAYLAAEGSGGNTYISATYLSSFKQRKGVILTQLPLPDTLQDFWRLVDCKEINTIVSLGSNNDVTSIKNFCQYWPKTVNESMTIGPYFINLMASASIGTNLTSYNLSILTEKKTWEVRLLHYTNWAGEVPDNTGEIIHLVDTLSTSRVQTDTCPLLFQCIDGASRSGLFSLSCDIVNRAVCDREIDIFQSARQVQSVRPQAVTKEAQYRYCYKLAQDYQRHMEVYQNT